MKIISFINDLAVIRKMLEHLKLRPEPGQPRPPPLDKPIILRQKPCSAVTDQEEFFDDGWPGYEEPYIVVD